MTLLQMSHRKKKFESTLVQPKLSPGTGTWKKANFKTAIAYICNF
jgi:hypothetical protein